MSLPLLALLIAGSTPGYVIQVDPVEPRFLRVEFLEAAMVSPKGLASAELMPTGELLITPQHTGSGVLMLFENGQVEGRPLRVGDAPSDTPNAPKLWERAKRACPRIEERQIEGEHFLHAEIPDGLCRSAVAELVRAYGYDSKHLRLVFSVAALQDQLRKMRKDLEDFAVGEELIPQKTVPSTLPRELRELQLDYEGATLRLRGKIALQSLRIAEFVLCYGAVGQHLSLDDQTERPDEEAR